MLVVRKPGQAQEKTELLDFLAGKVAKRRLPDDVIFSTLCPWAPPAKCKRVTCESSTAGCFPRFELDGGKGGHRGYARVNRAR